ncbi:MAG: ATP-binding protein [Bacteroidota bacterium]
MLLRDKPIRQKLMRVIMLASSSVLLLTCASFFAYEFFTFRQTTLRQLSILAKVIAANSTASLAFDSHEDAYETLAALKAEPHIVAACLYDQEGNLFAYYPASLDTALLPARPEDGGYRFAESHLIGFQPVVQGTSHMGTLFLKSDMGAMEDRFMLYGLIAVSVVLASFMLTYFISKNMQKGISEPILKLAETAKAVSLRNDYTVRATKMGEDEIGILTDAFNQMLTQIHVQNEEIQLFNQRLEQKVIDRTKELEVANKELEAFSYSVSHDLRAPLRSIDGYSRIMIEDYASKLNDDAKRTLGVIMKNAQRMGRLIDDLLTFSRIGKQNLTKVSLDMDSITMFVAEDIKSQVAHRDVEINIKPMLGVHGDSSMLKQVFVNLISNAIKYSNKKDRSVVEIGSYADNGHNVYYVKDNGAGFDMQYYDKLFGVFQRLHSANEFEGTGVGLALVQRIVTKHGGRVWAEGKVNEGATFYFSLPASQEN